MDMSATTTAVTSVDASATSGAVSDCGHRDQETEHQATGGGEQLADLLTALPDSPPTSAGRSSKEAQARNLRSLRRQQQAIEIGDNRTSVYPRAKARAFERKIDRQSQQQASRVEKVVPVGSFSGNENVTITDSRS